MAAVSSSRVAWWPSHRAPSGGTQLHMWEAVSSSGVAQMQWPSHRAPSVGTQLQILDKAAVSLSLMAQSRLCLPQSPGTQHIKVEVSMSRVAQWPSHRVPSVGTQLQMCVLMLQNSHRPDGDSYFACCLQGGGVYVQGGTVSFSMCPITGNTAGSVRAHAQNFPSPRWENADVLALTHACTTAADTLVNYRECVLQRP